MADSLQILDFAQASSGKSIPGILNRKRKPQPQPKVFQPCENQENSMVSNNETSILYKITDSSPMRSRSPLLPIEFNLSQQPQTSPNEKKSSKGLVLRDSWKRFRGNENNNDEDLETKAKRPKLKPEDLWYPFKVQERKNYQRVNSNNLLSQHQGLSPRMRTILLDWLIEVCEVYRLHRETFYLAADFFDRYMSNTAQIPKTKLQLIGVSCLFISAKIEEIYPPKLQEFAYVTDGACSEDEILHMELVILKQLNWALSPKTPNAWAKLLLQIEGQHGEVGRHHLFTNLIKPSFSGVIHSKIMHLVDLCMLDIESLDFTYPTIAASAIFFIQESLLPPELDQDEIAHCIAWMTPFAHAVNTSGFPAPKLNTQSDENSNYQLHTVDVALLELGHQHKALQQQRINARQEASSAVGEIQQMLY